MKKTLLLVLVLILPLIAFAQMFSNPESVEYDAAQNRYLVSNVNSGQIIAVDAAGNNTIFASDQPSIRGIHIVGQNLYTSGDIGVRCYSLQTGASLWTAQLPQSQFPNDIVSDSNGNLYVSDNVRGAIYRVNIATQAVDTIVQAGINGVNGLWFDGENNRIIFVAFIGSSPIRALSLATNQVTVITTTMLAQLDGITRDTAGNYYISSWGTGAVYRYDEDFTSSEIFSTGHNGPADIFFDEVNSLLVVPNFNSNSLTFIDIVADQPEVDISSFEAEFNAADGNVQVEWVTEEEIDMMGFNIYRATENDLDEATEVYTVESTNTSSTTTYQFLDENIEYETTYYYWLEWVDIAGTSGVETPVSVTTSLPVPLNLVLDHYSDTTDLNVYNLTWEAPNFGTRSFAGYNVYINEELYLELDATTLEYNFNSLDVTEAMADGSVYFYVTARYANPTGESEASNVEVTQIVVNNSSDTQPLVISSMNLYPNPFNPSTTLSFSLKEGAEIEINIYNIKGQLVKNLENNYRTSGEHSITWNGKDNNNNNLASGTYLFRLSTENEQLTAKAILMK